jgi:perosamine synthetase
MINIYNPSIKDYTKSAIKAIEDGWISNHGKYIEISTNKLNELLNVKYSILMANGTCTTHCLFLALKFKYPHINKIYVPNNCYVAPWNCLLMEYNKENLEVMKMDINTWNIDTSEEYIKSLQNKSAILIVHNLGNIINVPRLKSLRPDLIFIEDNCEGLFGKYENIYSGISKCSLCSSCSFYGNKIITTGEGGAFFTNDKDIYEYIKSVYSQGMSTIKYLHNLHAYNYRMTNIEAAFLYDQLNDLDNILKNKYNIFNNYDNLLNNLVSMKKIKLISYEDNTKNAPWIYSLRIIDNNKTINETTKFFKENNIDIRPFFYPINKHEHLKDIKNNDLISYKLNQEIILIPSSPNITYKEQKEVVNTIYKFIFYINNINIVYINEENKVYIFNNFLKKINHENFRYFNNRNIECLDNHILTVLLFHNIDNKYIGYSHINYTTKHSFGIYIDKNYRNKKIGSLLLNYTLNHHSISEIENIYLNVDKSNLNAIDLYKKYNFEIESYNEIKNCYTMIKKNNI